MVAPVLSIRNPAALSQAVTYIQQGQLVIIPTDTVYGIATQPQDQNTIRHLYQVRQREPEPALPFLISQRRYLRHLVRMDKNAKRMASLFWPGSLTLILPPGPRLPQQLKGYPIAVRMPNFPLLMPLLDACGGYLFATGAIRSGYSPAITAQEAAAMFGDDVALILDGGTTPYGVPSTILDCTVTPPQIRRKGVITEDQLFRALGQLPD